MSQMNALIPLAAANQPDYLGTMYAAQEAAQSQVQGQRQNALMQLYQQHGPGIAAGDPRAINALAQMDPSAALGVQRDRQSMELDKERIASIRQQSAMEARQYAATLSAEERAQKVEESRAGLIAGAAAWRAGDQAGLDRIAEQYGFQPGSLTLESYPYVASMVEGAIEGITAAEGLANPQPDKPASVVALEMRAKAAGLQPGTPQYQSFMAEGDAPKTTIINNQGGVSDKFYQTLDTKQAETFGVLIDEGMKIPSKMAQLDQLDQLLSTAPSGVEGALKMAAGGLGIPTEGLDDLQAADAIINSLVPAQRPVGSGTMSDRDVEMFRQSLPRVINQPGGNQKIMSALRGVMIYQQRQAEIANKVAKRQMTPAEGMDALAQLENPLEQFKRAGPVKIGNYTIEEVSE